MNPNLHLSRYSTNPRQLHLQKDVLARHIDPILHNPPHLLSRSEARRNRTGFPIVHTGHPSFSRRDQYPSGSTHLHSTNTLIQPRNGTIRITHSKNKRHRIRNRRRINKVPIRTPQHPLNIQLGPLLHLLPTPLANIRIYNTRIEFIISFTRQHLGFDGIAHGGGALTVFLAEGFGFGGGSKHGEGGIGIAGFGGGGIAFDEGVCWERGVGADCHADH
mmetsp:Transcript_10995/g.20156  ORF Transcript_10995/g.20156 Transcript_10995/m.20156 type:complete len:218 (-) Transcript_10995:373-1026(-)